MKKLLLSLLAVVGLSLAAAAEEVKFDFVGDGTSNLYGMTRLSGSTSKYNPDPTTVTDGAVTIKLTGNTRLWTDGLRFYKGSAMEISATGYNITGVTFGNNNFSKFNYGKSALTSKVWSGNAETVTFSCNLSKGNTPVNTLTITLEPAGEVTPPAVEKPVITTEEGGEGYMVTITCATEGAEIYYTIDGTEPTAASSKYTAPFEFYNTEIKAIAIKGEDKSGVVTAKVTQILTDTSAFGDMTAGTPFILKTQMTAIYQNGSYLYVKAGWSGNLLVYGNVGKTLSNGDTFSRLEGTYDVYNSLPEIKDATIGDVTTGGTAVEPFEAENIADYVSTSTVNHYLSFKGVTIGDWSTPTKGQRSATMTDSEGNTTTLYNQFKLSDLEAGTDCDVTGFVGVFGDTPQFYPTEIKIGTITTGIEDVVADENAPVEYYNLQGIRVENPAQGSVVIRRQGSKTTKMIVR